MPIIEIFSITSDPNNPNITYVITNVKDNNTAILNAPLSDVKVEFCTHDLKCKPNKFLDTLYGPICVHIKKVGTI